MNEIMDRVVKEVVEKYTKGGRGSGNWGHSGRPGLRGGSRAGGGLLAIGASPNSSHSERIRISRGKKLDKEILDIINAGANSNIESKIVPEGRAPFGRGKEYAFRRSVKNQIDTLLKRRSQHQSNIDNSRGARSGKLGRRTVSRSNIMIQAIDEAVGMARQMSEGIIENKLDFLDAKDIFDDIFSFAAAQTGGVKSMKSNSEFLSKWRKLAKKLKSFQEETYPPLLKEIDNSG